MEDQADPLRLSPKALYFLLSQAWDFYSPQDFLLVSAADLRTPLDFLFFALGLEASRIYRRGPDRAYLERSTVGPVIRGRLDVSATLRLDKGRHRDAVSISEELSPDCPQNRLIKAALGMARKLPELDPRVRDQALLIDRVFPGRPSSANGEIAADLRAARIHRNNRCYAQALRFARLILTSRRPGEGDSSFVDPFTRKLLNRIFEAFLRNYYARSLRDEAKVRAEVILWTRGPRRRSGLLPVMRTDVSIRGRDRCMVIDAKYYRDPFVEHHGKITLRSSHLFQLASYGRVSQESDALGRPWTGALVYATSHREFELDLDLRGFPAKALGLNLEASPEAVTGRLDRLWSWAN